MWRFFPVKIRDGRVGKKARGWREFIVYRCPHMKHLLGSLTSSEPFWLDARKKLSPSSLTFRATFTQSMFVYLNNSWKSAWLACFPPFALSTLPFFPSSPHTLTHRLIDFHIFSLSWLEVFFFFRKETFFRCSFVLLLFARCCFFFGLPSVLVFESKRGGCGYKF